MRVHKKIMSYALVLVAILSFVAVPVKASESVTLPPGWGRSTFWDHGKGGGFGERFSTEQEYDDYVQELPATGIDSEGYLYLFSAHKYVRMRTTDYYSLWCSHADTTPLISDYYLYGESANSFLVSFRSSYFQVKDFTYYYSLPVAPISGYYQRMPCKVDMTLVASDGTIYTGTTSQRIDSESYVEVGSNISNRNYFSASWVDLPEGAYEISGTAVDRTIALRSFRADYSDIYYRVRPYSGLIDTQSDTTYNTNTRAGSITGDFGILGDNNEILKADTTYIVNEDDNSVYNPVTNTTTSYDKYTYDYSDRSYTFSKTDGDTTTTTTVTYGDENITIKEGDTTYNVYYIYQNETEDPEPSPTPAAGGHTHHYTSTVTKEATCTLAGSERYVCDICGDAYNKTIPALGHNWEVKTQVATAYDDDGNIVTQGYTIYRCSRCGEEYKSEDGKAPPGGSDSNSGEGGIFSKIGELLGTVFGGLIGMLEALLGKLLDGLISLATVIGEKLSQVVEMVLGWFDEIPKMFGGFLDFLGAIFPFLPSEVMVLLTFGLAAVIFIGIIKAIRR